MERLNLQKSRQMAQNWLDDHMRDALSAAPEEERRLLETLYARQRGSMEYLNLIQLEEGSTSTDDADEVRPPLWLTILCHPMVDVVLSQVIVWAEEAVVRIGHRVVATRLSPIF